VYIAYWPLGGSGPPCILTVGSIWSTLCVAESRAKKSKNWEEADFYDSDDDTFLDRTGDVERKRQKRISRVKPTEKKTENFESLVSKVWKKE